MGERANITKTTVDKLSVDGLVWDTKCTGFHVRRQKSEARVYSVFYRTRDGRQRFCKIGRHGAPWTPDEARDEARRILAMVAAGGDPAGAKYDDRKAATVAQLCDTYLAEAAAGRILRRGKSKKASTVVVDRSNVKNHIIPIWGALKVAAVNRGDVEHFLNTVSERKTRKVGQSRSTGGRGAAARTMGLLGAIFSFAIKRGMRTDNPVRGVDRPADGVRTRRMSEDEYAQLGEALRALPVTIWAPAVAAAHFLAVSGWRKGEALALKWSEVDLASRTARLSDTKTGFSMRPLSHAACAILRDLPRTGELVFPSSRGDDRPMRGRFWDPIARRATLPVDITPHTLRHSFASVAGDAGFSELAIAVLLGHKKASITSRYVHSADAVLLSAADAVAKHIEERLGFSEPAGMVVEADFTGRSA